MHHKDGAFHDDHRPVDDDPEVDGPKAHQVGPYVENVHHHKGEQQRQRNGGGHNKAATPVAQKDHQYENYDQPPYHQVFGDGARGFGNKFASVEEGFYGNSLRKGLLDLGYAFLYILDHLIGVGIFQHHDHSAYGFPFP